MTLYYSIVFFILVSEMAAFLILVAPVPQKARRQLVTFLHKNPFASQISLTLKFTYGFILVLFIDSVNRTWRIQEELHRAKARPGNAFSDRDDYLARKFYAQRNMYLCGFTLFLSLILNRTYYLVKQALVTEGTASTAELTSGSKQNVAELKRELAAKEAELQALKSQSSGLSREYNRVADEINAKNPPIDRKTQ